MDADIAGTADQIVDHRAVHDLEPAGARRFADHDLGHVVGLRVADHVAGNVPVAGEGDGFAAECFGKPQRVGNAVALLFGKLRRAAAFDVERDPGPVQTVGEALGVAHETGAARVFADADQDALAGGPRTLDGVGLHLVEQLLVDALGGAAQGKLAQRRQIGGREEMFQRALGLRGT